MFAVTICALGFYLPWASRCIPLFIIAALLLGAVGITVRGFSGLRKRLAPFFLGCAFFLALSVTVRFGRLADRAYTGIPPRGGMVITGKLSGDSRRIRDDTLLLECRIDAVEGRKREVASASGLALIFFRVRGRPAPYYWGSKVRVPLAKVWRDDRLLYGAADWDRLNLLRPPSGILAVRARLLSRVSHFYGQIDSRGGDLGLALLFGIADQLSPRMRDMFRKAGATHILALSGMHLALLMGLFSRLFRPFLGKRITGIVLMVISAGYLVLTGMRPSLLRAVIMVWTTVGMWYFRRKVGPVKALFMAGFVIALLFPGFLYTISFQLSFLALFGILTAGRFLALRLSGKLPEIIALPISASVAAVIATAPITVITFGALYPIGIIASLLLTPLITIFLWMVLFYPPAAFIFPAHFRGLLVNAIDIIYHCIQKTAAFFAAAPHFSFQTDLQRVLFFVILLLGICLVGRPFWRRIKQDEL